MKIKRLFITALFGLMILFPSWCLALGKLGKQAPLFIGYVTPLTGSAVAYTNLQKKAIDVALDEINSSGGIGGRDLRVLYEDSKFDPSIAVTAMKKLIDVDKVPVILTLSSAEALAMAPVANRTKTILLPPLASAAAISDAGEFVFRISPSDAFQGKILAEVIYTDRNSKVAILYVNNDWGGGLKDTFEKAFQELGGIVVAAESSNPDEKDFRTQLTKIKATEADALVVFLHPQETINAIRQIRELGIHFKIYGGDTFSHDAIYKEVPNLAEGIVFTLPAQPSSPEYQAFAKVYEKKYGAKPGYNEAAAYDAIKLIAETARKACKEGCTGEAIRKELSKTKGYKGTSGEITFDENGDVVSKKFDTLLIHNGRYQKK